MKLADFGVAAKMDGGLDTQTVVGTPYWMAPEIIQMSGFTTSADIWSVGCTVHELITGKPVSAALAPRLLVPPLTAHGVCVHAAAVL